MGSVGAGSFHPAQTMFEPTFLGNLLGIFSPAPPSGVVEGLSPLGRGGGIFSPALSPLGGGSQGTWHGCIVGLAHKFELFTVPVSNHIELTRRHCYFADDASMCCPPPVPTVHNHQQNSNACT